MITNQPNFEAAGCFFHGRNALPNQELRISQMVLAKKITTANSVPI